MTMDRDVMMMPAFSPEEACVLRLRALFEQRGYIRAEIPRFEDYSLYLDNKSFPGTDQILTFTDVSGRLLALKPDVTLSIAKNIPAGELPSPERLYYIDEVVRFSPENRAYKVQGQLGLERIGRQDDFSSLEVLDMALRSLALIGEESAMDISHLGFFSGLLEDASLPPAAERDVLAAIYAKSAHGAADILEAAGAPEDCRRRILEASGLHGPFLQVLERARALVSGPAMAKAFDELSSLRGALSPRAGQTVNLDFSVVNDLDYYNGRIFRGYIKGIPGVVCSGGQYDNLMHRLGKRSSAIGFAVFLHRLAGYFASYARQADVLITYPEDCDWSLLLRMAESLGAQGLRVRCEREDSPVDESAFEKRIRYQDQAGGGQIC